jgi:transposase InsO family protein
MNIITQKAKQKQAIVKYALKKKNKKKAAEKYGVSLASVKRWCKRYDGTWQSLIPYSRRPKNHPNEHTEEEKENIKKAFAKVFYRYGWDGVYAELKKNYKYKRSLGGMYHCAKQMGLGGEPEKQKKRDKSGKFPDLTTPGEKVQIDVKFVPYNCLKGDAKRDEKRLYQWTAIDECTRKRFIYGFDEHSAENTEKFFLMLQKYFNFPIQTVQTDNGTEFTYKFISDTKISPLDELLDRLHIKHKLIPPRTPWHNGKVERSHRNDQRYFYDFESFGSVDELNKKLSEHLKWSNSKPMRVLSRLSPDEKLAEMQRSA